MTVPPIVGVPRLVRCEVGPSSRMNWPYCRFTNHLMNHGVPSRASTSEVAAATRTPFTT
jgi:hypothetical protein